MVSSELTRTWFCRLRAEGARGRRWRRRPSRRRLYRASRRRCRCRSRRSRQVWWMRRRGAVCRRSRRQRHRRSRRASRCERFWVRRCWTSTSCVFTPAASRNWSEVRPTPCTATSTDGRVAVERLANHEHGFAMGIAACAEEGDVGGEGDVAGDFLPGEVEVVDAEPHVFAAAGDGVGVVCACRRATEPGCRTVPTS